MKIKKKDRQRVKRQKEILKRKTEVERCVKGTKRYEQKYKKRKRQWGFIEAKVG